MVERTGDGDRRSRCKQELATANDAAAADRQAGRGAARRAVVATAPVAGGDISTATRLRLSDGTTALMKTYPQAPEGFFDAEAARSALAGRAPAGSPCPTCSAPTRSA